MRHHRDLFSYTAAMPASEIDEIFASTRNAKTPLVNEISLTSKKKSKKTSKTLAPTREVSSASDAPPSSKRLHPETIEDPSLQFKRNTEPPSQSMCRTKMSHKKMKMSKDNEERFKNSRGTARVYIE